MPTLDTRTLEEVLSADQRKGLSSDFDGTVVLSLEAPGMETH
jgi:hypothetical protein